MPKWYRRTMQIVGRPGSSRNALYRKFGRKRRDNEVVRRAFHNEVNIMLQRKTLVATRHRKGSRNRGYQIDVTKALRGSAVAMMVQPCGSSGEIIAKPRPHQSKRWAHVPAGQGG